MRAGCIEILNFFLFQPIRMNGGRGEIFALFVQSDGTVIAPFIPNNFQRKN